MGPSNVVECDAISFDVGSTWRDKKSGWAGHKMLITTNHTYS